MQLKSIPPKTLRSIHSATFIHQMCQYAVPCCRFNRKIELFSFQHTKLFTWSSAINYPFTNLMVLHFYHNKAKIDSANGHYAINCAFCVFFIHRGKLTNLKKNVQLVVWVNQIFVLPKCIYIARCKTTHCQSSLKSSLLLLIIGTVC